MIALSGGGDSMALARLAKPWADASGVALHAVIIDHGLAPHSADHAEFAATAARHMSLNAKIIGWRGEKPETGVQAAARQARHALIADAARDFGAGIILTGHTLDDQAETVWMRAARGGHWRALAGMTRCGPHPLWPQGRGLEIIRPLLDSRRDALRACLQEGEISWIEDPANENARFERIRIRGTLARLETAGIAPERLASLADSARSLADREDAGAAAILTEAEFRPEGWARIPLAVLRDAPAPLAGRALQGLIAAVSGQAHPPARDRADQAAEALTGGEAASLTLGGALLWLDGGALHAARDSGAVLGRSDKSALPPMPLTLDNPADWDGRYQITALEAGLTAAPLGRNAPSLPAAARNRLSGLPERARATLPVLMRGADIAAAPLLDYNAGLAGLDYLAPARLAHMRLGAKTAGPGGEWRSGAPHSDSEIRGERRSLKPGLGP